MLLVYSVNIYHFHVSFDVLVGLFLLSFSQTAYLYTSTLEFLFDIIKSFLIYLLSFDKPSQIT